MADKIVDTRFTIQFSKTDPTHLHVAEILNRQGRRSKAQYIVNAVLHYENCDAMPDAQRPARLDEKAIEAVVNRILRDRADAAADAPVVSVPIDPATMQSQPSEEINYDDALEALGEDGFNAVNGALDMFRKKEVKFAHLDSI